MIPFVVSTVRTRTSGIDPVSGPERSREMPGGGRAASMRDTTPNVTPNVTPLVTFGSVVDDMSQLVGELRAAGR